MSTIRQVFDQQKKNRWKVSQSTAQERIEKLKKLKAAILKSEADLIKAMHSDFRKSAAEVEITEVYPTLEDINFAIKHLATWMAPKQVSTPMALMGTTTYLKYEAKGLVLIMAPWNYPFQLLLAPLVAAIAAGNCAILRPSEKTSATSRYLHQLISTTFSSDEIASFEGGVEVAEELLKLPFDHIFFTGSTFVGKKVMAAASHHLATVTLELGGKSPFIVLEDADLAMTAKRLVWGKFLNAGQTCVAPDYVYVHESIADGLLSAVKAEITAAYGTDPKSSPDFPRSVDMGAFDRVKKLTDQTIQSGGRLAIGGQTDFTEKFIAPTVVDQVKTSDALMTEEIFGPVLPILRYKNLNEVISYIQSQDKPLALYIFGFQQENIDQILNQTSSGATVVNNLILHLANPYAPFGGVGGSGQGSYHGEFGFRAFSHERTVMRQGPVGITHWLYPPYRGWKFKFALKFLRLLSR